MNKASDFIKKAISKNFGWKIFSILMAVLSWFVVMNIINPTEVRTYSVNLTLLNKDKLEDNEFVILNEKELEQTKVDIKVRAVRPALDELSKTNNRKNIKATIDLQQFDVLYAKDIAEPLTVTVTPSLPSNLYIYTYEIISFTPGNVSISLDNLVSVTKTVTIEKTGEAKSGYTVLKPVAEPSAIQIKGAESEIEKIDSVKVMLDLTDVSSNVSTELTPVIYDKNGKEMTGFELNTDKINVTVGINKQGQIRIEAPKIQGEPASGYRVISTEYSPKYIEVVGSGDEIKKVSNISLPTIDITGATENKTVAFDIRPYLNNTSLSLKSDMPNEITVSVKIEKEESKDITIPVKQLNVKGLSSEYDVELPESIVLSVTGLKEATDNISENDITGNIDLTDLQEGNHTVEVQFTLPDGITQSAKSEIIVIIKKDEENKPVVSIDTETVITSSEETESEISTESEEQTETSEQTETITESEQTTEGNINN